MKNQLHAPRAAGFAFIEIFVALSVLMTAMAIGVMAFNQATANRRLREKHDAAREAVALSLERIRALDTTALPKPGETLDLGVPPHLKSALPGATCVLKISASSEPGLVHANVEVNGPAFPRPESAEVMLHVDSTREAVKP